MFHPRTTVGINICLSAGDVPFPHPVEGALCGPTKPGTTFVPGQVLESYNPCPLNACCNIWGQCGITPTFCICDPGESPDTSVVENGCIWSCGTTIINTAPLPTRFGRIGYYDSSNFRRECLRLSSKNSNIDGSNTHIHWAFAKVSTDDWTLEIDDPYDQWDQALAVSERKIISVGGWAFSTEPGTSTILREAMLEANRDTFATHVVQFLRNNKLDGFDFDWDYPGNYLDFLTVMKSKLHTTKSMSVAAPASYYYLRAFPIKEMAELLDYIVYMTYDLHGQWDAGNPSSVEGCPTGNCLRSHGESIHLARNTYYALTMITKAGVATSKIFVGKWASSTDHTQAKQATVEASGCCSQAAQTPCVESWHDQSSDSDMLVYNG
ncbi:glycoside hydrolase family 18 protein [Karstenula rhodostoma CBS 690.94]|uniref:chitinase n=1 Tax=Karstenula rhodostoma CBS 690.94 TaxID=1392251 RepID=A0A9P4P6A5_9PLEO|nr:glycoside hydrolase family 18 protein [Karstenula rhodostoma CBS 690.94]